MIFVGYHHLMENFLKMNQGLSRRILHRVHLQDFTPQEILTICFNILRDEVGLDTSTVEVVDFEEELHVLEAEIPNKNASLARELAYKIDKMTQLSLCDLTLLLVCNMAADLNFPCVDLAEITLHVCGAHIFCTCAFIRQWPT